MSVELRRARRRQMLIFMLVFAAMVILWVGCITGR